MITWIGRRATQSNSVVGVTVGRKKMRITLCFSMAICDALGWKSGDRVLFGFEKTKWFVVKADLAGDFAGGYELRRHSGGYLVITVYPTGSGIELGHISSAARHDYSHRINESYLIIDSARTE